MSANRRTVILSLAAFIAATSTGCWTQEPAVATSPPSPEPEPAEVGIQEGNAPPDFTLRMVNSDETVQLSQRIGKGRPVVLVFGSYT